MMGSIWVVLFVALAGSQLGHGLPIGSSPQTYPHEQTGLSHEWFSGGGVYAAVPALAVVLTGVGLLFGCTWCYRHKDCKLFSGNAQRQDGGRAQPPDSGFSEPANNNVSEDNNNGPISLREMQNIANNNAAAYIVSANEERNRSRSRESVVEFEPLPVALGVPDPLERCADWFVANDFPRSRLQYLREIGRGWFGRIVEGEIEDSDQGTVAVKILNQNASPEDKARFLDSARLYRDVTHENVLRYVACCLQQEPWMLVFELCNMDLQQYLVINRPKMAILNESGVPLRLQCDVASALAYLHSRGLVYGNLWSGNVLVRGEDDNVRAVLGQYNEETPPYDVTAPELRRRNAPTCSSDVWSLGALVWEVCSWGATPRPAGGVGEAGATGDGGEPPEPALPCPYRTHLYQVMQLCWQPEPAARPSAAQALSLLQHLLAGHRALGHDTLDTANFEERWQRLKPNTIPKLDEHVAVVHAPSERAVRDTLSVDPSAVSRSSSVMSDKDLSVRIKSESMNNLHGSLEDFGADSGLDGGKDKDHDRSDGSVDPWLKDIIAGSQDDVSYYKDVSDVIKNLDNILNSEKTSSSESSHQASPSRDNLSLDCKKEYPVQSSLVKSPGINNFQNFLDDGCDNTENDEEDDMDRDTVGTLSHSFERHSDTNSQHTLENLTPITPVKDFCELDTVLEPVVSEELKNNDVEVDKQDISETREVEMPKENEIVPVSEKIPQLKELRLESTLSVSEGNIEQLNVPEDCQTSCDNIEKVSTDTQTHIATKSDNIISDKQIEREEPIEEISSAKIASNEIRETTNQPESDLLDNLVEIEQVVLEINEKHVQNGEVIHMQNSKNPCQETLNFLESEKVFSSLNHVPQITHEKANDLKNAKECETVNVSCKENDFMSDTDIATEEKDEINESPKNSLISDDRVIEGIVNNKEIVLDINSIYEIHTQNNEDEMIFEDKHMSGEDMLLEGINENTHQSDHSSTLDLLPDLIENAELPSEELKTKSISESLETHTLDTESTLPLERPDDIVQNTEEEATQKAPLNECTNNVPVMNTSHASEISLNNESTVYMDLINTTKSDNVNRHISVQNNVHDMVKSCTDFNVDNSTECVTMENESTVYMDLPTIMNETDRLLHAERVMSSQDVQFKDEVTASTPKSECGEENERNSNKRITRCDDDLYETKTPDYGPGVTLTKFEQKYVPDTLSPFDSPTKSHPTDTYDENSSVVLGPFENCTMELFKSLKSTTGYTEIDLPQEEVLAFSSNFSEINLETPSPLRDGNFLTEVPDIEINEDIIFDDINEMTEQKSTESHSAPYNLDHIDGTSESVQPPSTPPNSPGTFLASTSKEKYLVDVDLNQSESIPNHESDSGVSSMQKEIDLNQIEFTAKLAMAENENNLNIEYSGPLTVEGLVTDDGMESYLAGNGAMEETREGFSLDEACMQALRNELELKLPLAQVASIEPSDSDIPTFNAPELIVNYSGALSPIVEETRHQLSAYENDRVWNISNLTDSSESYLEPCNNSTDEVTDLPTTGAPSGPQENSTYTLHSDRHSIDHNTYTVQKDATSRDLTMSIDSLNGSPAKHARDSKSPVNDRTYTKDDEKESNCDRLSQVSPFLLSPTTDTSVPTDNATGISTLSKTTDAKASKPSDNQGLSKATSIDSWCSNDTLYNVEENFDDLALDADVPDFEDKEDHSDSTDTLTHNDDDDKEMSHCSTYMVNDSKSERCETFSPDSITANCTYTKAKADQTSQIVVTEVNDSPTKNTLTKDLAYETLASGLGTYSNCSTDLLSGHDDMWRFQQPELVRRSPVAEDMAVMSPTRNVDTKIDETENSPKLESQPRINKMDSVEITCLQDNLQDSKNDTPTQNQDEVTENESPDFHYRNMAQSVQSTPILEADQDVNAEAIPMQLPDVSSISFDVTTPIPNFLAFINSAELRPQDMSCSNQDTDLLLEGENRSSTRSDTRDMRSPTYSDFEVSAMDRPQDIHSKSSQSTVSTNSEEFHDFENSVRNRPQDISCIQQASSMLLMSERSSYSMPACSTYGESDQTEASSSRTNEETSQIASTSPVYGTAEYFAENFINIDNVIPLIIVPDHLDEDEQPHSIIVTENPKNTSEENVNVTYNSHTDSPINHTFNSHTYEKEPATSQPHHNNDEPESPKFNSADDNSDTDEQPKSIIELNNPVTDDGSTVIVNSGTTTAVTTSDLQNGDLSPVPNGSADVECNGKAENFAIVNFINESFEELRDNSARTDKTERQADSSDKEENINGEVHFDSVETEMESLQQNGVLESLVVLNGDQDGEPKKITEHFLEREKIFCQLDSYLPMLSDIRFTGPASEIMSTSFNTSPPETPEERSESTAQPNGTVAEILKEWDSDSDESHSSNPSSGEFIWKDGDGRETSVVPSNHFEHQRGNAPREGGGGGNQDAGSEGSSGSGSGSEGDEVQFVPSSWDCRAEPAKSSLRSQEQQQLQQPEVKKRVVFKRQKYHCVYEYPREVADTETLPDYSTYADWAAAAAAEEAELSYGQLYGSHPFDLSYPLRAGGVAFGSDYDEDFFISSSAHPFESLGALSSSSQFFPGKSALLPRPDDVTEDYPPPPSPPPPLDFTTPDSGVEDVTPGSTAAEDYKMQTQCWKSVDSGSSSESVSPSSPGNETLGGLRHTRDKLKLDLPPSPHVLSPRHSKVFNFVLDKSVRRHAEGATPLVMTDDTPVVTSSLPLHKDEDVELPAPTFSTFGKGVDAGEPETILIAEDVKVEDAKETPEKGEGTVLDSGDEDSGIESSAKATLDRNKQSPNVS